MRLIDADALKETINAFFDAHFVGCVSSDLITYAKGVDGIIDNTPTVTPKLPTEVKKALEVLEAMKQGKWIPISERLPEKIGTYLVTLEYKEHGQGITTLWYHGEGIGWDLRVADVVTAWQPLPEPYKEGGTE